MLSVCNLFVNDSELQRLSMTPFFDYFMSIYFYRTKLWAFCYRENLALNTYLHFEALHKKIKYRYFGGTTNRRLNVTIKCLLEMIGDIGFEKLTKVTKRIRPRYDMTIRTSHNKSIKINQE